MINNKEAEGRLENLSDPVTGDCLLKEKIKHVCNLALLSFSYTLGEHRIRVASSIGDRCRAWALVYAAYLAKGYAKPNAQRLWYGLHDALPNTTTFLAERRPNPCDEQTEGFLSAKQTQEVATLTLVFDSPLRLPSDDLYAPELDSLRSQGRRLCEIISLVNTKSAPGMEASLTNHLFKLAYHTSYSLERATDLVITVNPRHALFYERYALFQRLGEERPYGKVNGAPAVLLRLDLERATPDYLRKAETGSVSKLHAYREFMLESAGEIEGWLRQQRTPLDIGSIQRYFAADRPILQDLKPELRRYLLGLYGQKPEAAEETPGFFELSPFPAPALVA